MEEKAKLVELWFYSKHKEKWVWRSTSIIDKDNRIALGTISCIQEMLFLGEEIDIKYIYDLKDSYAPMDEKRYNNFINKKQKQMRG